MYGKGKKGEKGKKESSSERYVERSKKNQAVKNGKRDRDKINMTSVRLRRERRDRYKFHYFSNNISCVVNLILVSMIGLVLFTLLINQTYCNAFSINCNNFNSTIINDRDNHRQIFMIEIGHEVYEKKILIRFLFVTFHHHFV